MAPLSAAPAGGAVAEDAGGSPAAAERGEVGAAAAAVLLQILELEGVAQLVSALEVEGVLGGHVPDGLLGLGIEVVLALPRLGGLRLDSRLLSYTDPLRGL